MTTIPLPAYHAGTRVRTIKECRASFGRARLRAGAVGVVERESASGLWEVRFPRSGLWTLDSRDFTLDTPRDR